MAKNVIDIASLTKYYGKHKGIENVTFSVEEGEIFGFIGPNGAGKSTTIRTLLALIYPTSGSATIFGKDCIKFAPEIAKEVGYLPSEVFYYDGMKVKELLNYAASFYKKDCTARIKKLADRLELDLSRKIEDLSYGNKKKVGIIQGLLHEPKLIILDEPTSGLDPIMQQTFFELLRDENKAGASILFSSHILGEVQRMCNRVAIIKNGSIIELQKISELQKNTYKKCFISAERPLEQAMFGDGVENFTSTGNDVHFLYNGNINDVVAKLGGIKLLDLSIEEPGLEEIFLHYYK